MNGTDQPSQPGEYGRPDPPGSGRRAFAVVIALLWLGLGALGTLPDLRVLLYVVATFEQNLPAALLALGLQALVVAAHIRFARHPFARPAIPLILLAHALPVLVFYLTLRTQQPGSNAGMGLLCTLVVLCIPSGLISFLVSRKARIGDAPPAFAAAASPAANVHLMRLTIAICLEQPAYPATLLALGALARHRGMLVDDVLMANAAKTVSTPIPDVTPALRALLASPARASLQGPDVIALAYRLAEASGDGPDDIAKNPEASPGCEPPEGA